MANKGVAPLDAATEVGRIRLTVGDTQYKALVPAVEGFGDYTYFSDEELASFLVPSPAELRATGFALYQRAHAEALKAVNMATDDLRLNTVSRSEALRLLGDRYIAQADAADAAALGEVFAVIPPWRGAPCVV